MHIVHIHDRLSVRGGADIHLLAVAAQQALRRRVTVVVGRVERGLCPPPGVELLRIRGLGGRAREASAARDRLAASMATLEPDLLHLHNVLQPEVMSWVADQDPAVATVQDHRSFCPGRGRVLPDGAPCTLPPSVETCARCLDEPTYTTMITTLTQRRARALTGFSRVVVLSSYMAGELASAGLEPARLRVIPPFPWSPGPPQPPPPDLPPGPFAIAAGRLVWAKGFHLLLEAWARVRPPLPLLLVGEGPARRALEIQALALGLGPDEVHFTGWLPRPRVEGLLGSAQVALMPSLWAEPFGIAGLEAQAQGVPVIAFDVGGVASWLQPEHGWLVPAGSVDALVQAIGAASDPLVARRRGLRAAHFVAEHFDPEVLMDRLDATYREALAAAGQQG
jgi:glycosyltransferase involved in cell wall biosynthesis